MRPSRWSWFRVPYEVYVLAVLALTTRLIFITSPRAIVFDEVYFRDYALRYSDGSYYFDLHPPLGKLLLAGWAQLTGVDATHAVPAGTPATASSLDPAIALRLLPAIAGAALIVAFYYFLRELGAGRRIATLGAGLLMLDNALLVQSRLILIDSMLLLFGLAAITLFLAARRHTGRAHWMLLAGAAALAGMSAATKLTGLTALGVIGLTWGFGVLRNRVRWRVLAPQAAVLVAVPVLIYASSFFVHFALLPNTGQGDAFMSKEFQSTLVGNPSYDPAASMSFPDRFIELNDAIKRYEHSLNERTHEYSSSWVSWPIEKRGVYYWTDGKKNADGEQRYIYMLGNPLVWWGVLIALAVVAAGWIRDPDRFGPYRRVFAFLGGAWALSYLPFAAIERPMFLYHYFFPLMFSLAAAVFGLGVLAGWLPARKPVATGASTIASTGTARLPTARIGPVPEPPEQAWAFRGRGSAVLYWGILSAAFLVFLWFAPLSYGLALSDSGLSHRMWLDSWR